MRYLFATFIIFLPFSISANECSPKSPLTEKKINTIREITADALTHAGLRLDGLNCFTASAIGSSIMEVLGYTPIKDYQALTSVNHAFMYFPRNNLITDVVFAQFRNPGKDWIKEKGFTGTPQELQNYLYTKDDLARLWSFSKDYKILPLPSKNNIEFVVHDFINDMFSKLDKEDFFKVRGFLKERLKEEFGCDETNWSNALKNHKTSISHRVEKVLGNDLESILEVTSNNQVSSSLEIQEENIDKDRADSNKDLPSKIQGTNLVKINTVITN